MEVKSVREEKKITIYPIGHVDALSADGLQVRLSGALEGIEELIFDCKDVKYLSSAGLRLLLFAQKTMDHQGKMTLVNVPEVVRLFIEISGFDAFINIE